MASPSVFVLGGAGGQSASGAVKGKCFESALEFGGGGVAVAVFCFGGGGGQSASGAVKGKCFESALEFGGGGVAVCFCFGGRRGPVSFRGCEGGNVLSQLWSLVVVASPSVFVLGGRGASQLPGL